MAQTIPNRISSVDAYRGFVMFLMMAEVLEFGHISRALPESSFWAFLAFNQDHVEWVGCSLHDLIQPSFSFLVGVALPYSVASRVAKGQTFRELFGHTLQRSLILIFLGVFLRSMHESKPTSRLKIPFHKSEWGTHFCFGLASNQFGRN